MKDFFFKCWMKYKQINPALAHNIEMEVSGNSSALLTREATNNVSQDKEYDDTRELEIL